MSQREVESERASLKYVLPASFVAGALIGGAQGLVGYFPRLDFLLTTPAGAMVGAVVAAILGSGLYLIAFRKCDVRPVLRSVAWVSGACGVLASLVFRWWTHGEGANLSMFVTPVVAIITAATVRAYIWAKSRAGRPACAGEAGKGQEAENAARH